MRDLLSDLNNYAWTAKYRYASDTVNDVIFFVWRQLTLESCEFHSKTIF